MKKEFDIYTKLINNVSVVVESLRCQDYCKAMVQLKTITNMLVQSSDDILQNLNYYNQYGQVVTPELYVELIENITKAQEKEDYLYLADLLDNQFIPLFEKVQDVIKSTNEDLYDEHDFLARNREHLAVLIDRLKNKIENNTNDIATKNVSHKSYNKSKKISRNSDVNTLENAKKLLELIDVYDEYKTDVIDYSEYVLQSALNGELTLFMGSTGIHIHSTVNPSAEAVTLAKEYYKLDYNSYIVWGIGLGYHVKELLNVYAPQVTVIEPDIDMIMLALMNMEFEEIEYGRLQIICDSDYTQLAEYITGNHDERIVIYSPELKHTMKKNEHTPELRRKKILEKINQVFIRESSIRNNERRMNLNFKYNIANCIHYVDEIEDRFKGKKVIIVAAGPSLDKNVAQLKTIDRKTDEYIILAVGTVYKKLLNMGIKPDYVIIIEANESIISQISGVEDTAVPLLILSTAYRELARKYQGKKYLIDQYEYDHAEDHAQKYGYKLYSTGGSVTTTATSVAITLGARTIIFIGFDLSYPDGISHADGTSGKKKLDTTGFIGVESIDGTIVYATNVFIIYRNWIENEIKKHPNIEFIDATEGGAKIAGTKIMSLEDALKKK